MILLIIHWNANALRVYQRKWTRGGCVAVVIEKQAHVVRDPAKAQKFTSACIFRKKSRSRSVLCVNSFRVEIRFSTCHYSIMIRAYHHNNALRFKWIVSEVFPHPSWQQARSLVFDRLGRSVTDEKALDIAFSCRRFWYKDDFFVFLMSEKTATDVMIPRHAKLCWENLDQSVVWNESLMKISHGNFAV